MRQGPCNMGDGMGTICGEKGPIRQETDVWCGVLLPIPKPKQGSSRKSKFLQNLVLLLTLQSPAPRTMLSI